MQILVCCLKALKCNILKNNAPMSKYLATRHFNHVNIANADLLLFWKCIQIFDGNKVNKRLLAFDFYFKKIKFISCLDESQPSR